MKTTLLIVLIISALTILGSCKQIVDEPIKILEHNETNGQDNMEIYELETIFSSQNMDYPSHEVVNADFVDQDGISAKIQDFLFNENPRLESEFQAMVYMLFLAGVGYQIQYEAPIEGKRIDLLLKFGQERYLQCIVIQLKRNGNIDDALDQAQNYSTLILRSSEYKCTSVCSIGINLTRLNLIQFRGSYEGRNTAYIAYRTIARDLVANVKRTFRQIKKYLRA